MRQLLRQVEDLARRAGRQMLEADGDLGVREKSGRQDLVTRYDGQIQQFLETELLALLPEAGFLGEEGPDGGVSSAGAGTFIVDPIDGTTNFVRGLGTCAVSIGLALDGGMALGVVYDPYRDELFSAVRGGGACCNGRPIRVTGAALEDAVVAFGTTPYRRQYADRTFALARALFLRSMDVRRMGAASLDLCALAAGRVDCYFECLLSPWDYAAGSLIAQEAGAVVTALDGGPLRFDRPCSMAAGTAPCHRALLELAAQTPA